MESIESLHDIQVDYKVEKCNGMHDHEEKIHRDPFMHMKIADNRFLNDVNGRSPCIKCNKSRKFFCYSCYVPVEAISTRLPVVKVNSFNPISPR